MTSALSEPLSPHDDGRKRVAKACDRCRLKKIKCDGKIPCTRCQAENTVCRFGERKKSVERRIPPGYVEYLEEQQKILVKALKKTWQDFATPGPQLAGVADPPVHSILEDLGVLSDFVSHRRGKGGFRFEEDLEKIRLQCEEAETSDIARHSSRASSSVPDVEERPALMESWSTSSSENSESAGAPTPELRMPASMQLPRTASTWPMQPNAQNQMNADMSMYGIDWSSANDMDMDCDPFDNTFQTISPTLLDMSPNMSVWDSSTQSMGEYGIMTKGDDSSLSPNVAMLS